MGIFQKRISYKTAGALLFIILFFAGGTTYLLLSARENKDGKSTQTATKSASPQKATASAQSTTDESGDTSKGSKEGSSNSDPTQELGEESPPITLPSSGNIVMVTITSFGFSPPAVTINAGDTVEWVNNDNKNHWPASNPHPQHTDYSGFDSSGISAGSSWSFKFGIRGTWDYHDHNIPAKKGTVVVQ